MRLLFTHIHEGVWFSKGGHSAYLRGEKPARLWPIRTITKATVPHHIAVKRSNGDYSRELVMFYKELK